MSASLRNRRVLLYRHVDDAPDGRPAPRYVLTPSAKSDRAWWASRGVPTGREVFAGASADRQVDAVFGVAVGVLVDPHGLVEDGGEYFRVLAVLPRANGADERQVLAQRVDAAEYVIEGLG